MKDPYCFQPKTLTHAFSVLILLLIASLFGSRVAHSQSDEDREAVARAVLDYVEGFYLVQPERIERSVSKKLSKVGYVNSEDGYREVARTYDQLYNGSKRYMYWFSGNATSGFRQLQTS